MQENSSMPSDGDAEGRPPRPESKTTDLARGAAAVGDLLAGKSLRRLQLPYPGYLAAWRLVKGHGKCIQGVNGRSTHRGTLCYSFDFKLAVGTPVLAARGGVIAAVVDHFRGGGAKAHLAPRANFVAVRHSDGSYARYYHLREKGSCYKVGERVERGQQIAWSGNTGYTGGPHLHFDLVNLLPEETSTLRIVAPKQCRKRLQSIAAAFSCELPAAPLRARVVHVPCDAVKGDGLALDGPWIALSDRDPACTFAEKINSLAAQGASACIIANNRSGPELFAMGGCEDVSPIPCVLVSKEHGLMLKAYLSDKANEGLTLELGRHAAVIGVQTMAQQLAAYRETPGAFATPLSCKYGPDLRYVTRTLPVEFIDKAGDGFVPEQARTYPKPVLCVSPTCGRRRRRRRDGPVEPSSERGRRVDAERPRRSSSSLDAADQTGRERPPRWRDV